MQRPTSSVGILSCEAGVCSGARRDDDGSSDGYSPVQRCPVWRRQKHTTLLIRSAGLVCSRFREQPRTRQPVPGNLAAVAVFLHEKESAHAEDTSHSSLVQAAFFQGRARMRKTTLIDSTLRFVMIGLAMTVIDGAAPSPAEAQVWRGTAPFCEGGCLPGEREIGRSKSGDGGACLTGSKALCEGRDTKPCQSLQTNVECKGVVLLCNNGFYTQSTNRPEWHSCSKYACGACFGWWSDWKQPVVETAKGLSPLSIPSVGGNAATMSRLPYGPDTCKPGFVWREAIQKDRVCVTPASREQARSDNALRTSRVSRTDRSSGPDTCIPGYVWREAVPSDRVCVTPQVREQTRRENAQVEITRVRGAGW